ncbi:MAG: FAD-binding oxidoreductase [Candidatus Margulisbacteria bacterium]|nr:FAD-binding oxidoreductase [Candidatus Margulisiibacteriota bacterium]
MIKKTDPDIIKGYLEDSSNLTGGHADGVYLPESEAEIAEALTKCNSKKIPLTVSAGQTGTTGGCIPFGGWILTTHKLNKIINIDKEQKFAVVQPGVTLEELEKAVAKEGLLYPPDPTEKTATLGGNVSTNASGGRCYRFGSTRNWIKRLKIVFPSGEKLDVARNDKIQSSRYSLLVPRYSMPKTKNSAGYFSAPGMDLVDLFIGSEGTLGIVTEIEVALAPALQETFDIVAFFPTEEQAVDFVEESKKAEDKEVNFYEFFDENTLQMLKPSFPHIPAGAKAAVYIEQEIVEESNKAFIDYWAELIEKYGGSLDNCWLAADARQKEELAKFRHAIPEHINELFKQHHQTKLATDIAVPAGQFKEMFEFYRNALRVTRYASLFYIKFGHIGDNHLHVNLLAKNGKELTLSKELVLKFVRKAVELGGTVSAEHGIGKIKHDYLKEMYGDAGIKEMVRVKKEFDPAYILGLNNIYEKERLAA